MNRPAWERFGSEFVGTAALIAVGCSLVIVDFGRGSPVLHWIPDAGIRRALTGFLFGSVGGSIAVSRVGRVSGAHINPMVTFAFWVRGKIRTREAAGYMLAQCLGAIAGALPLLLWGSLGQSVRFAATTPGVPNVWLACAGEIGATWALIVSLFVFIGHSRLRAWTPGIFPLLYAGLVFLEAPLSGTSTNPARSLGPALIGGAWSGWWVDWLGPLVGCLAGLWALRAFPALEIEVAKLYHFYQEVEQSSGQAEQSQPPAWEGSP